MVEVLHRGRSVSDINRFPISLVGSNIKLLDAVGVTGPGVPNLVDVMRKYVFEVWGNGTFTVQIQAVGPSGIARNLRVWDEIAGAYVTGNYNIIAAGFFSVDIPPYTSIQGYVSSVTGAAEVSSLQITNATGATAAGNAVVTLDGAATNVALLTSDNTAALVATKIRGTAFTGWTTGGSGDTVTFTANAAGVKADAAYSAGTTGAAGTMTTTTQGGIPALSVVGTLMQ